MRVATMRQVGGEVRAWAAPRPWAVDAALATLVTVVSLLPLWQMDEATVASGFAGPTPLTVGVASAMTVPLAWRRRSPLTVLLVIASAYLIAALLAVPGLPLGLLIGIYTLTAYGSPRAVAWGMSAVALSTVASLAVLGELRNLAPNLLVLAATGLFGDWQRLQRARAQELVLQEAQLRRARQEVTRLALERERQRIAEEVRDVLAHAVTAMITQAQAARRLAVEHADRAVVPLQAIEETGRAALVELRRLVGLLRDESAAPPAMDVEGNDTSPTESARGADPPAAVRPWPAPSASRLRVRDDAAADEPSWQARARNRFASMSPVMRDVALVLAVVAAELSLQLATYGPGLDSVLLVVLPACTLLLRRRFPQWVLAVTLAGTVAIVLLDVPTVFNVVLIAMYTVANRCPPRARLSWLVVSLVVAGWLLLPEGLGYLAGQLLFLGGAWLLGDRQRVSRRYQQELEQRARQLEDAQQRAVALGVAFERTRIARELHDVIGNSIGVMLIQASGARRTLPRDPERADAALEHVLTCGRESLAHLRTVVPTDDEGGGLTPQPGLEDLPELVAEMAVVGLQVELQVEGESQPVPAGVALSAYRIVQEALTNVLKHAATDHASVRLSHGDILGVEITDRGRGGDTGGPDVHDQLGVPGGHGLIGMAERVRLVGGTLQVGPRPEGGFRILARLPVVAFDGTEPTSPALAAL